MKKIFFLLAALAITSLSFAQAPQGINYQGVARTSAGAAISNHAIGVQFKILQGSTAVYIETHAATTDTFGLYHLVIGQGTTSNSFSSINWGTGVYSIEVDIDGSGGTSYVPVSTSQLMSVPYALYSGSSTNGVTSVTVNAPIVNTSTVAATPNLSLASVITPTIVGSSAVIPQITVDQYGRVTNLIPQTFTLTGGTVTSVSVGAGLVASPNPIVSIGGFDLPTFFPNSGTVGSANAIPVINYDKYGRIIGVSSQTFTTVATVNSVGASSPLFNSGTITSPVISSHKAGTNSSGYLDSTDWNTFNNKVTSITPGLGIATVTLAGSNATINADNATALWNANQLKGFSILTATPTPGQVLTYTAGNWAPTTIGGSLPTPTVGSLLYSNSSNSWTPTNPSNISSDGNSIKVVNTNTAYVNPSATFSSVATSGSFPVLKVAADNSQGFAIEANNASGAAIVANSSGPYTVGADITNTGSGDAIGGGIKNSSWGNAISGYIDPSSTGHAGNFYYDNNTATGTDTVVMVINKGSGYSASFNGGKGIQTDKIKITGPTAPVVGSVLTATNTSGDAVWAAPSGGGVTSVTTTSPLTGTLSAGAINVGIPQANGSTNGYLSMADWTNFTGKGVGTVTSVVAGTGLLGGTITVSGTISADNTTALWNANKLQGTPIVATLPLANQILQFIGGNWTPTNPPALATGSNGLSGSGNITLGGNLLNNTTINQTTFNTIFNASSGNFQINNSTNASEALYVSNTGSGAAIFALGASGNAINASSTGVNSTIIGSNSGTGPSVSGINNGTGPAGTFTITNNTSGATALVAGTTGNGPAFVANAASGGALAIFSNGPLKLGGPIIDVTPSAGISGDILTSQGPGAIPKWLGAVGIVSAGGGWSTGGNAISVGNFLGTTNLQPLVIATTNTVTAQPIIFKTGGIAAGNEKMRIDANGNVGIGINAPVAALHIKGASDPLEILLENQGGAFKTGLHIKTATHNWLVGLNGSPDFMIKDLDSGLVRMDINVNGNVGIGTTTPGAMLDVVSTTTVATINSNNTGSAGSAGLFKLTNASNGSSVLFATTNGTGQAAYFQISNAANGQPSLFATTNGIGGAGYFNISNTANNQPSLFAITNGTGQAGSFQITNATNSQPALFATTNGTGNSGNFTGGAGLKTDNFTMTNGAANGAVLMSNAVGNAAWAMPINFSANSSATSVNPTTGTTIIFSVIDYNSGGGYVAATGIFTAPANGLYHFDAGVAMNITGGAAFDFELQLQGPAGIRTSTIKVAPSPSYFYTNVIAGDFYLNAGQTVKMAIYHDNASAISPVNSNSSSWFSGHLVH